ncbi:Hsp70 family protein [Micromonospora sp. NPDC047707]|uniref:Hsp70 family protein n=1 Tax=Micromonospora sp. NPDC047707 TaxID=3154498 RepID=UPI003453CADD
MSYVLGIDIGNTNTVAAVARRQGATWARPETVVLDGRSTTVPSVLHVSVDGTLIVGEPDPPDPGRTARCFLRRVGDEVPLLLGGEAWPPHTLTAALAAWVVDQVAGAEGGPAEALVFSHPSSWGPHRRDLLQWALREVGLHHVTLLPRAVTVAESHAARGVVDGTAAVYALGGETFEAALVRRTPYGTYETFGRPQALDTVGGVDFDEALAEHVRTVLARDLAAVDPLDAPVVLRTLLPQCELARRGLSLGDEVDVLLALPGGTRRVPVTRPQFETMIRPAVRATVDLLVHAVHSAVPTPAQLDGVLLAGGSARVPLIADLLTAALGIPVEVEPDPHHTTAVGAALAACQVISPSPRPPTPRETPPAATRYAAEAVGPRRDDRHPAVPDEPPPRPPVRTAPLDLPKASRLTRIRARGREG